MRKQINRAIKIAYFLWDEYDSGGRVFHSTFAFRCQKLCSIGVNNYSKSDPKTLKYNYTNRDGKIYVPGRHAEFDCVRKLGDIDYSKLIFINIRIDRNGKIAYSKPCSGCERLFNDIGYKEVIFSTANGEFKFL